MKLIAELKRRNVFRVAVFYIVSSWLIVQIAETVLPVFDVPDVFVRGIIVVLAIGFVPALVFAWAFELTPDGIKRDKHVRVDPETKQKTSQKLNWATLGAALLAIGLLLADRLFLETPSSVGKGVTAQETIDRSIAVLPFLNMSTDAENEFFADGMSEELLNILAGIDGLRVASRTSAFAFKGQAVPIPEIAQQLGVRHILEGSVRRQGDRVRITAQLIDAQTDAHLWSETYERELTDIFRVQESIATAITDELAAMLGGTSVEVDAPTGDLEAYERFLRGRSLFYRRDSLDQAMADLTWAVERDPGFAQAWAFLAAVEYVSGASAYPTQFDRATLFSRSKQTVDRALALDADIAIAQAVKGNHATDEGGETFERGMTLLESAASKSDVETSPKLWYGLRLLEVGHAARAREVLLDAHERDPLVPITLGYLGIAESILGRNEAAEQRVLRTTELNGDLTYWAQMIVVGIARNGDRSEASGILDRIQNTRARQGQSAVPLPQLGWLSNAIRTGMDSSTYESTHGIDARSFNRFDGVIYTLALGDDDRALAYAADTERGSTARALMYMMGWMPALRSLREHPEFFQMAREAGYLDYWQKHGFPLDCRPVATDQGERLECGESS